MVTRTKFHKDRGMGRLQRAWALVASALVVASLACGRATALATAPARPALPTYTAGLPQVPERYRALYDNLSEALSTWEDRLDAMEDIAGGPTIFGAELLPANGNRGAALLQPSTMAGVRLYLDRLQELGVAGVTIQISDPLLWPDYPQSDEYAAFFAQVADDVRSRGLTLLVETGPAFTGTSFSSISFDWASLSLADYWAGRRVQLERIADEIRPDYLSLGGEPSTEAMLTGFDIDVDEHLDFVRQTAVAVDRSSGVRVGSGSGSWEDPEYARRLAAEPQLDFYSLHIYPLTNGATDYIQRAAEAAGLARAAGKPVVVGEAWLYKATPEELRGRIDYGDVYARDPYSFWQPLDARFVELMVRLTRAWGVEYVSFFWSGFFFDYLDYDETLPGLPLPGLLQRLNREQADSLEAGRISETGRALREMLGGGP